MTDVYRKRRAFFVIVLLIAICFLIVANTVPKNSSVMVGESNISTVAQKSTIDQLERLAVKGRAPKTGYSREQFGRDWAVSVGCNTRNIILNRDMTNVTVDEKCNVTRGTLNDPYSGKIIQFTRGAGTSSAVQIDHIVALSDAWQKGAQQLTKAQRVMFANDPLELLAVDGPTNVQKSDGDAATWLPPNKSFRCQYIARQIAVKNKYSLWVTRAEHDVMLTIIKNCTDAMLPSL